MITVAAVLPVEPMVRLDLFVAAGWSRSRATMHTVTFLKDFADETTATAAAQRLPKDAIWALEGVPRE